MARVDLVRFAPLALEAARGGDIALKLAALLAEGGLPSEVGRWARRHKITPLFAVPLHKLGHGTESAVPKPAYFMSHQLHLRQQLQALDEAFAEAGTAAVLLKGAVYCYRPIYPRQGLRQIGDLDVLIRDERALAAFAALGYMSAEPSEPFPKTLDLPMGEHHLAPIWRERDAVRVEPHVLPARADLAHLLDDVFARAQMAPGCKALLLPDPVDQLLLGLVHGLLADRDSMHGGLFVRSMIELELLFESLNRRQKEAVQSHLKREGIGPLWQQWRNLAGWALYGQRMAPRARLGSMLLIGEVQLREQGQWGVIMVAVVHQCLSFLRVESWRSGRAQKFLLKLRDVAFWQRFAGLMQRTAHGQGKR